MDIVSSPVANSHDNTENLIVTGPCYFNIQWESSFSKVAREEAAHIGMKIDKHH